MSKKRLFIDFLIGILNEIEKIDEFVGAMTYSDLLKMKRQFMQL